MPPRASISLASSRGIRLALASSFLLALPLFASLARAKGADPSPVPEGQAVAAAPPAPLVVAADPAPPPAVAIAPPPVVIDTSSAPERVSVSLVRADGGVVIVPGHRVGGYGNVGFDALFNADRRRLKPVWGLSCGWEFFALPGRSGGGGFNLGLLGGLRSPRVFALVGAGVNLFTFDLEKENGGGGILSPRASARVGFFVGSFHLGALAQVQRRWQWGSDDLTMVTLGLALGGGWEEREDK